MILSFPSFNTLSLVISSGSIPAEVTTAPCSAAFDPSGSLTVESSFRLTKAIKAELLSKGVEEVKRHVGTEVDFSCWLQLVPTVAVPGVPTISQQAPVLFELPDEKTMSEFVTEMLRLGNDRQSFRHVAGANGTTHILLRVIGPPYYTLLRAIERFSDGPSGITAFVERAPRVWVELGQSHPFAGKVKLADGQMLLISSPHRWSFTADVPFRDVYEILDFPLPHAPVAHADKGPGEAITIPLRLTVGNSADVPEFWVLPQTGFDSLDALVRDADERLLRRLRFAVAVGPNNSTQYVLNVAPSKQSPPILALPGLVAYKSYWKLPNLFLPVGQRLHPPLRRETVRKLLADDPDQAIWLSPDASGRFVPHAIPFDAFRPLDEWVNYIVEREREPIAAWIAASTFDFDSFVCPEGSGPKSGSGGGKGGGKASSTTDSTPGKSETATPIKGKSKSTANKKTQSFEPIEQPASVRTPSEWELRRGELEKQFLADNQGELDSPERIALWADLADCHAALNDKDDAAICYAHAIWTHPADAESLSQRWLASELGVTTLTPERFDSLLKPEPTVSDVRTFAAATLASIAEPWFASRIPAVQKYLVNSELRMPVRATWLIAQALARQSGADVLGLARARDRILSRLFDQGLHPERDMPNFLRYAGLKDSDRAHVVREKAQRIYSIVRKWVVEGISANASEKNEKAIAIEKKNVPDTIHTPVFVDYAFAYCFARLQDSETALQILTKVKRGFETPPSSETEIFRERAVPIIAAAYEYRIEQALAGRPNAGPLPETVRNAINSFNKDNERSNPAINDKNSPPPANRPASKVTAKVALKATTEPPKTGIQNPYQHNSYCMTRLFEQSRILDPQERKDALDFYLIGSDEWGRKLLTLETITKPDDFVKLVQSLLAHTADPSATKSIGRLTVLLKAIPLAVRIGESFAVELIEMVANSNPTARGSTIEIAKWQGQLFERSLFVAAHFDRRDLVTKLVDRFIELVHEKPDDLKYHMLNAIGSAGFIALRKLGLRDVIDRLLGRLQEEILNGQTIDQIKARYVGKNNTGWPPCLQALLNLAAGWLAFDLTEQATAVLNVAEKELHDPSAKRAPLDLSRLIKAYVTALGSASVDVGLDRIEQFFETTDPARLPNGLSTIQFFSKMHLDVVEGVILAIVKDDGGQALGGRRWRDEDEYLVRKRIHEDVRACS